MTSSDSSWDSPSKDAYDCFDNGVNNHEDLKGLPLIEKKSRLIAAVFHNHVEALGVLLDSPEFYNVQNKYGYSLLQIAIRRNNIEVFDYMLSIPDFPLEFVNEKGQTALAIALHSSDWRGIWLLEHFAYELIRKGACIDKVCFQGNMPLHCAIIRFYHKTAKLLIEKEVDVNISNRHGFTPLSLAISRHNRMTEVITTLLAYGAEASVCHFDSSVLYNDDFEVVQEALFLYIYDEYSSRKLRLDVLLKLAKLKSLLFYRIIESPIRITICDDDCSFNCFHMLCTISIDCLHLVIQKYGHSINEELFCRVVFSGYCILYGYQKTSLENLNVMLESDLKPSVMSFISSLNTSNHFFLRLIWCEFEGDETSITQFYCYLLSYGFNIEEEDLHIVYNNFGYCELFKILLHMDVQMGIRKSCKKDVMPVFVYDVSMNLEQFFKEYSDYNKKSFNELLCYFVHPKLNEICFHVNETMHDSTGRNFQEIPLLVELARNVFRKFFIEKFKIKTCREFYSRLHWLPISNVHKKIISYETKLY